MNERPRVEDSYATAVRALRLMHTGNRREHQQGSDLLASMGLEAVPALALLMRQAVAGIARFAECDPAAVYDEMALQNIEQTEELDLDD